MTKEIPAALLGQSKLEVDPIDRGHSLQEIVGSFGEVVDLLLCPSDAARSEPTLAVEVGEGLNPCRRRRRVSQVAERDLRVGFGLLVEDSDDVSDRAWRRSQGRVCHR